jgi:tryprostatin B 6-hydroxylase
VYEQPEAFIPERWYSKPELVKHKSAFAPFSLGKPPPYYLPSWITQSNCLFLGAYSCVGKQLALMELRFALTEIVAKFDIAFAPGEDGSALMDRAQDVFTVSLGDLKLP